METVTVKEKRRQKRVERKRKHKEIDAKDVEEGFRTAAPEYIKKDGLRYVKKYNHVFRGFCKRRWVGEKIKEVCKEFQAYPLSYYLEAMKTGKVLVNDKKVTPEYEMQHNDQIQHYAERLETPILDCKIKIISEDADYLVVDKPPSLPIHPCGNYYYNCLKLILGWEYGYKDLKVVHRLDKQTSGVVFFAKHVDAADEFAQHLQKDNEIKKVYYARVKGKIEGDENFEVSQPIYYVQNALYGTQKPEGSKDNGKEACTKFEVQFYSPTSNTSVLKCYPITGRTHQIRVHLKHIGHPIANDDTYGGIIYNKIAPENPMELEEEKEGSGDKEGDEGIYTPQLVEGECMAFWLHAWKYTFKDKEYATELPPWTQEEYDPGMVF